MDVSQNGEPGGSSTTRPADLSARAKPMTSEQLAKAFGLLQRAADDDGEVHLQMRLLHGARAHFRSFQHL